MTTNVVFCRNRNLDEKTKEIINTASLYIKNKPIVPSNSSYNIEPLSNDFLSAMDKYGNSHGEKGGECYNLNTINDIRLPLFQMVRNTPRNTVNGYIQSCINSGLDILDKMEINLDLFRLSMHLRDKDEGKGERDLSYWMIVELHKSFPKSIRELVKMLPVKYGCWLDYLKIIQLFENDYINECEDEKFQIKFTVKDMMKFMCNKILEDNESDKPSLLAKWWPRESGKYSKLSRRLSIMLCTNNKFDSKNSLLEYSETYYKLKGVQSDKKYKKDFENCKKNMYKACRKFISNLNKRIGTIEILECSGKWSDINPSSIPSKHLKIRSKAFQNLKLNNRPSGSYQRSDEPDRIQCAENFKEYYEKVRKGEVKINANGLFIYELVKKYYNGAQQDETWELQFQKIVDETPALESFTCLADTSGSMFGDPILVAISLAALISKKSKRYPNRYISFNTVPSWKKIVPNASLFDIVKQMKNDNDWGGSTDFAAAMDLMIQVCKKCKVSKEEVKQMKMVIVSDMQFDSAKGNGGLYGKSSNWKDSANRIKNGWAQAGYSQEYHPEIIYWNVRHTDNFVAQSDTLGVQMMSGYNQTQLKVLLKAGEVSNNEAVTPLVTMRTALDTEYFDDIVITLQSVGENIFENLELELITNNVEDIESCNEKIKSDNSLCDEEIELRLNKLREIRK